MSNALKADFTAKISRLKRLQEELDLVKRVAIQNQAFEAVYESIERDFPPNEKNSFLHAIGGGASPIKEAPNDETMGQSVHEGGSQQSLQPINIVT